MNVNSMAMAAMKPEMIARGSQSARTCSEVGSVVMSHLPAPLVVVYLAPALVRNRCSRAFEAFGVPGRKRGPAPRRAGPRPFDPASWPLRRLGPRLRLGHRLHLCATDPHQGPGQGARDVPAERRVEAVGQAGHDD